VTRECVSASASEEKREVARDSSHYFRRLSCNEVPTNFDAPLQLADNLNKKVSLCAFFS